MFRFLLPAGLSRLCLGLLLAMPSASTVRAESVRPAAAASHRSRPEEELVEKVRKTIDKGVRYLKKQQTPQGNWEGSRPQLPRRHGRRRHGARHARAAQLRREARRPGRGQGARSTSARCRRRRPTSSACKRWSSPRPATGQGPAADPEERATGCIDNGASAYNERSGASSKGWSYPRQQHRRQLEHAVRAARAVRREDRPGRRSTTASGRRSRSSTRARRQTATPTIGVLGLLQQRGSSGRRAPASP